jgi:hypothetical protein
MATRAFTKVSINGINNPIPLGPLSIQIYRCQGGTVGDTVTITAADAGGKLVAAAVSGNFGSTTLSTSGDTQVVFTLTASTASTSVTFDAILLVTT